ncbi:MAG: hypothetical protein ACKOXM_03830 [Agromyces sp.]
MAEPKTFVASLIVQEPHTKLELLDAVAQVLETVVADPSTPIARVPVSETAWVHIEVPKFGEDVQPALDVVSSFSGAEAELEALALRDRLRSAFGWTVDLLPGPTLQV